MASYKPPIFVFCGEWAVGRVFSRLLRFWVWQPQAVCDLEQFTCHFDGNLSDFMKIYLTNYNLKDRKTSKDHCTHTHRAHTRTPIHTRTHTYAHILTHTLTHTHTHAHVRIHTHRYARTLSHTHARSCSAEAIKRSTFALLLKREKNPKIWRWSDVSTFAVLQ